MYPRLNDDRSTPKKKLISRRDAEPRREALVTLSATPRLCVTVIPGPAGGSPCRARQSVLRSIRLRRLPLAGAGEGRARPERVRRRGRRARGGARPSTA